MYKLIINLKTYEQTTNKGAVKIAKAVKSLNRLAKKKKVEIILVPQFFDIKDCIKEKVSTYSQHIDPIETGAGTGHIAPSNIAKLGAKGTLISHSEHLLSDNEISKRIKAAKASKLISVVCARNVLAVKKIAKLKPDFIAVEPKELIGGDISISTANPKLISDSNNASGRIPLLAGAGVKNGEDVRTAVKLGAKGILVASGVTKSKNFKAAIKDLLDGF